MSRPRKKDKHLPPCVHYRHGAYYLIKEGKWKRLGTELGTALATYAGLYGPQSTTSFERLIQSVMPGLKEKISSGSYSQYKSASMKLRHVFWDFSVEQIRPLHVKRLKREMIDNPGGFNTCLTVLRQVMEYAVDEELIEFNPCIGTKPYRQEKRKRLITTQEYDAIYAHATPQLQVIMDLLYLTGQRVMDVLTIRHADLREDGIYFEQDKTEARLVVAWTPELNSVVRRARGIHGSLRALTLLHSKTGRKLDYDTILNQWRSACAAAGVADAQLRDLRAMSLTRVKQERGEQAAQAVAGHTTVQMTRTYLRDKEVPTVQGPTGRKK
jgi:integrase